MSTSNRNKPYPDTTCFLCNIPFDFPETEVLELFPNGDQICRTSFPRDPGGKSRGSAFISYQTCALCQETVSALHGKDIRGPTQSLKFIAVWFNQNSKAGLMIAFEVLDLRSHAAAVCTLMSASNAHLWFRRLCPG